MYKYIIPPFHCIVLTSNSIHGTMTLRSVKKNVTEEVYFCTLVHSCLPIKKFRCLFVVKGGWVEKWRYTRKRKASINKRIFSIYFSYSYRMLRFYSTHWTEPASEFKRKVHTIRHIPRKPHPPFFGKDSQ